MANNDETIKTDKIEICISLTNRIDSACDMESSCILQQTLVRKESQEQREKTIKSGEQSRPVESSQEKPSREEPTPEVQRQEQQSKKDKEEQEQLELEQLMEWSSEGENDTTTRKKRIFGNYIFIGLSLQCHSPWTTVENKSNR